MATLISIKLALSKAQSQILPLTKYNLAFSEGSLYKCAIHTSSLKLLFFESDPKAEYKKFRPKPSNKEIIRNSLQLIKEEIQIWKDEVTEAWDSDFVLKGLPGDLAVLYKLLSQLLIDSFLKNPSMRYNNMVLSVSGSYGKLIIFGVVDKMFEFRNEKDLKKWIVTSDKDNEEGKSVCQLTLNGNNKARFTGDLCLEVPKDGIIKKTGYCNIRTIRYKRSFQRDAHFDWGMYTHLVLRVRGDGRSYGINLSTTSYFDQTWNDVYTYALFTRGGPYWQYTRIPFSKFFFTSKGRIQDKQFPVPLCKIASFGITLAERAPGPFSLEIDFIGLEYDPAHQETFAYEMYKLPSSIAST